MTEENNFDMNPEGTGTRTPASPDSTPEEPIAVVGNDDLPRETRVTLRQYLSKETSTAPNANAYPVLEEPHVEFTHTIQGNITPPAIDNPKGGFVTEMPLSDDNLAAASYFSSISSSGKFVSLAELITKFARTKEGHNLLATVNGSFAPNEPGVGDTTGRTFIKETGKASPLQKQVSSILKSNRFSPTENTPYIQGGAFSDPGAGVPAGFGTGNLVEGEKYNYEDEKSDVRNIGAILTVLQTGHTKGEAQIGENPILPATLLPTQVQIGFSKIDTLELYSGEVVGFSRKRLEGQLVHEEQESFGAMNSWREPFEGSMIASILTAGTALAATLGAALLFGIIFELLTKYLDDNLTPSDARPGRLPMGAASYSSVRGAGFAQIGMPTLVNGFAISLMTGLAAFLGLRIEDFPKIGEKPGMIPGSVIGGYFVKVATLVVQIIQDLPANAAFLSVLARVVNRDFIGVLDSFGDTLSSPMGIAQAALNLIGLIAGIASTPSFRFFMVLAVSGDKVLQALHGGTPEQRDPERLLPTGRTRVMKSREDTETLRLAWRHKSAPGMMLLPPQIIAAFSVFDRGLDTPLEAMNRWGSSVTSPTQRDQPYDKYARKAYLQKSGRIPKTLVERIENALEAEYMPFYFHDLRTNEIISFHAFLDSLSDSYSANYAETGGYGRMDKVKVYQETGRDIKLDFVVAATSPEDFDSMWWSINKLVTLVYPQWSMGTKVVSKKDTFVQPFSQIPTASPMIRLRVGDVIKSNYSRFNLARLFGIAETKFKGGQDPYGDGGDDFDLLLEETFSEPTGGSPTTPAFNVAKTPVDVDKAKDIQVFIDAQKKRHQDSIADGGGYEKGEEVRFPREEGGIELVAVIADAPETNLDVKLKLPDAGAGFPAKIKKILPMNKKKTKAGRVGELQMTDDIYLLEPDSSVLATDLAKLYTHDFGEDQGGVKNINYWVTRTALNIHEQKHGLYPDFQDKAKVEAKGDGGDISKVSQLFSPLNNGIVQSFESAMGRGLAGFITSLDLDWNDSTWETAGLGNRAPMWLRISIGFAPIHDIAPGLDNHGFTRAMNYPVGKAAATFGQDQHDSGYGGIERLKGAFYSEHSAQEYYKQAMDYNDPPKVKKDKYKPFKR